MKKTYKIFFISILLLLFIIPLNVNAQELKNFNFISISNDLYSYEQIKIYNRNDEDSDPRFIVGNKLSDYCLWCTVKKENKFIKSITMWENSDYVIKEGLQDVNITLYVPLDGNITITIQINGEINDTKTNLENSTIENVINETGNVIPSLTTSSIILESNTKYDMNYSNVDSDSTSIWTSDDTNVVKVNKKTGLITAIKKGNAIITCRIITPNEKIYILKSNVIVESNENITTLTDSNIILSINDYYNINVENTVYNSKYRWSVSNSKILSINASTGKVTAISNGKAFVYCTITTPDRQVIVLKCKVTVN